MLAKLLPHTLKGFIIFELLHKGVLTSAELLRSCNGRWGRAAVYKELSLLHQNSTLLKIGSRYTLTTASINDLNTLSKYGEQKLTTYFKQRILPRQNRTTRFSFNKLAELDSFILELASMIINSDNAHESFDWSALPWGNLIHETEWNSYRELLHTKSVLSRSIFGYQAPITKLIALRIEKQGHKTSFISWKDAPSDCEHIIILSPFIITIELDEHVTSMIQQVLHLRQQELSRVYQHFFALLQVKINASVSIKHHEKTAKSLTRTLKNLF